MDASSNRVVQVVQALRDKDCPYLGNYKLGYDAALDDVLRELVVYAIPNSVQPGTFGPVFDAGVEEGKRQARHATPNRVRGYDLSDSGPCHHAFMDGFGAAQDGEDVTVAWAAFKAWVASFGDSDA